jgi:hypothetical protein
VRSEANGIRSEVVDIRGRIDALDLAINSLIDAEPRTSGWKAIRIWVYVIALAAIAAASIQTGTTAFGDLKASQDNRTSYAAIAFTGKKALPKDTGPIYADFNYDSAQNSVMYSFFMPASYLDYDYSVVLTGEAMFPTNYLIGENAKFTNCKPVVEFSTGCEIITGNLRRDGVQLNTAPSLSSTSSCDKLADKITGSAAGYIALSFFGPATLSSRIDAFHKLLTLPMISGQLHGSVDAWNIPFPSRTMLPDINSCRSITTDGSVETESFSKPPDASFEDTYTWGPELDYNALTVVVKPRRAERWGNAAVAAGGAAAGLSIGFIPLAYEATGSWRRRRRLANLQTQ